MNRIQIDEYTSELLELARNTYGNKNQILVCMEELNELACVLAKYPRYEDEATATQELYEKVLDEVADVTVILSHVKSIFNISDEDLDSRISKKLTRLKRWLNHSESMQETVDDRAVDSGMCGTCIYKGQKTALEYTERCCPCMKAQVTEGRAPFYKRQ